MHLGCCASLFALADHLFFSSRNSYKLWPIYNFRLPLQGQSVLLYLNAKYLHAIGTQIASRVIHQYAMLFVRATLKLNVSRTGNIERPTLKSSQLFCSNFLCVLVSRYNKTNNDWRYRSSLKFFAIRFWGNILRTSGKKIVNDDLDPSHYLYSMCNIW